MPSPASVVDDLLDYFRTEFAAREPTVQILEDNDPPLGHKAGTTKPDTRTGEWVRISVQVGAGSIDEVNCDTSDQLGRVLVSIFTPLGTGTARSWALFDTVRDLFQGKRVGDARCRQTEGAGFGASPDNVWFQNVASTRFRFESTPA